MSLINQDDNAELEVIDYAEEEDASQSNSKYQITSYGADYTVDSLVARVNRKDIYIPAFQRSYVWTFSQASKFIESLLLGLPVPGIFMSKDDDKKLLVIDGQQRLVTLQRFYEGLFDDRRFILKGVRHEFENKTYSTLSDDDRRQLDDSILHATIIQQTFPEDDEDSSIYHIFERLNTGGTRLQPQEIRISIYHGKFIDLLKELNENADWRRVYGAKNKRSKDQELILRFLALYFDGIEYQKPLNEFLNDFTHRHRKMERTNSPELATVFSKTIEVVARALGRNAFRSQRVLNTAIFDSIMVAIARRLERGPIQNYEGVKDIHDSLIQNEEFVQLYTSSTTDEKNVAHRIALATTAFAELQ